MWEAQAVESWCVEARRGGAWLDWSRRSRSGRDWHAAARWCAASFGGQDTVSSDWLRLRE